jgi:two-component system cell cycle sensor histidine kinase/response regulator CckA
LNRLLLVDDDPNLPPFVKQLLGACWDVECVSRAEDATALLAARHFDAALIDHYLGAGTGVDVVRAARAKGVRTPLIVLTGVDDRQVDLAAMAAGADDFILKSELGADALDRALRYALRHAEVLKQLEDREQHFRALIQHASDAILLLDREGMVRFASDSVESVTGFAPAQIVGRSAFERVHPDDLRSLTRAFEGALAAPGVRGTAQYRAQHANGSWRHRELSAVNCLDDLAVGAIVVNFRDVTDRAAAEAQRDHTVARLQAIIAHLPLSIWVLDAAGRVTLSDGRLLSRFGVKPGELVGQSQFEMYKDHPLILETTRRALQGDEVHELVRFGDGVYETWYTPLRDGADRVTGTVGIALEVTERLELEEQFRQSQKMEAVGLLAGGVAHDFNNILTAIIGFGEMALEGVPERTPLHFQLGQILRAGHSASALTRQLLAFSRRQVLQPAVIDLNATVKSMHGLLSRVIGEDIRLETDFQARRCIFADPGQIEQIVLNLSVNARDAMPHGGRLALRTMDVEIDEAFVAAHRGAAIGPHVRLDVEDSGIGMTEEVQSRIFEPFFTTKERGHGTGLGLATVYGIVQQSGGSIWVYSKLGAGTTFTALFPIAEGEPLAAAPAPPALARQRGHETILIVEDEEDVREIVRLTLARHGYTVHEAATPSAALTMVAGGVVKPALLFTDFLMPEMNGRELAARLQRIQPDLRVLFTSGYAEDDRILEPGLAFLPKPFTTTDLLASVREVLNRAAPQ